MVGDIQGELVRRVSPLAALSLALAGCACLALAVAALYFVGVKVEERRQQAERSSSRCLINVKQLSTAMLMYAQDWDDRFPPAEMWSRELMPYVKNAPIFQCPIAPQISSGYAMNTRLSKLPLSSMASPASVPGLFDSSAGVSDATGRLTSFTPRHLSDQGAFGTVGFADGHAKRFQFAPPP